MIVLIADKFPAHGIAALGGLGLEVENRPSLGADDIPAALEETGVAILVVRSTKVTADAFERAKDLSLVVRAGAGVNTIDLEAASARGVFVANCPGKNAIAVAELTMGHILALDRHIVDAASQMRTGTWNKKKYGQARGLFGRTLALVGFGAIAREVAVRAQAFGMQVTTYDPVLTDADAEAADVRRVDSLATLVTQADVVSVHVPYSRATHHLVDGKILGAMKEGACLIHLARGGVVDDTALAEAVGSGRIRAALDVLEDEPAGGSAQFENPLTKLEGVYATPHIGASTDQAQSAIADEVVRIVSGFLDGGPVPNAVNVSPRKGPRTILVVRHLDRVGVLAGTLEALRKENINVQEMNNIIFAGNHSASATIALTATPSDTVLDEIRQRDDVLAVSIRVGD